MLSVQLERANPVLLGQSRPVLILFYQLIFPLFELLLMQICNALILPNDSQNRYIPSYLIRYPRKQLFFRKRNEPVNNALQCSTMLHRGVRELVRPAPPTSKLGTYVTT